MESPPSPSPSSTPSKQGPKPRKHLGWAPPTLYIPPPQDYYQPDGPYSANLSMHSGISGNAGLPPHMYQNRASEYMFNRFHGIRDFTMSTAKSGLGFGEKSAFWMYNKISSWSKKWFTHIFLSLVIIGYTVGGAILFQTIEGANEEKIVKIDIRVRRRALIEELRNLSIHIPQEKSTGEWHGIATSKLQDFEDFVINAYKNDQLIVANHGPKIWSFWNAVVYCSTIYTTIENADAMETSMAKIEAMVTPEQVFSASVAKKRRTITRKRTSSVSTKARSQTPVRAGRAKSSSEEEEEEVNEKRPKTPDAPERRRRTVGTTTSKRLETNESESTPTTEDNEISKTNEPTELKPDENIEETVSKSANKYDIKNVENTEKRDGSEKGSIKERPKSYTDSEKESDIKSEVVKRRVRPKQTERDPTPDKSSIPTTDDGLSKTKRKQVESEENEDKIQPRSRPKKVSDDTKMRAKHPTDSSQTSEREDRASSIPRQFEEQINKLVNKKEIMNLFQKAKTTVEEKGKELRRRRFNKTEQKRSLSTPKQLTESDLLESFRKAQVATAEREKERIRSESARRYSSGSDKSATPEPQRPTRKPAKPTQPIKKKPLLKQHKNITSNKIIEILDPKTSKVIAVKDVGDVHHMSFIDILKIFHYYTPGEIIRQYRKYKKDMVGEYSVIRKQRRRCINHLIALLIICGLGGMVFKFTEGHFENFYKCGVKRVKRDFIDLLWTKSHSLREEEWKSLARTRLRTFEEELHTAHEAGIHSYSGQRSWSFLNGLFYCMTVVTTIGYGHIYPTTTTGQALTIVYSLIGIPLFLIILTDFGKLFTRCIKFVWSFVRRLYYTGSCRSVRKTAHVQEIFKGAQMMYDIATFRRPSTMDPNLSPPDSNEGNTTAPPTPAISNFEINDEFNLPISLAILLLVIYIFTGAILFQIWEGWDFFASFYFVFISMSTIGFGDYVPRHPIFKIISIVYLVFGLALMSMCINVVQVKLSDTFSQASAKIGATIGLGVAEDGSIKPLPVPIVEMPEVHGSVIDIHVNPSSPTTSSKS